MAPVYPVIPTGTVVKSQAGPRSQLHSQSVAEDQRGTVPLHDVYGGLSMLILGAGASAVALDGFEIERDFPRHYPALASRVLLYRYFNLKHGLDALQAGRWKIGRLTELNDPLDCSPHIHSDIYQLPPDTADISRELLGHMSDDVGLLCYSKVINDPVLWSHYADGHRGIALGFDLSDAINPPIEVEYTDTRPLVTLERVGKFKATAKDGNSPEADQILKGYTTKAKSWAYESEYRNLINLEKCRLVGNHYFSEFDCLLLRQVVLGARCPITIKDIRRMLSQGLRAADGTAPIYPVNVEIRKSKGSKVSFKLDFEISTEGGI